MNITEAETVAWNAFQYGYMCALDSVDDRTCEEASEQLERKLL